jgi:hypothetical protein
MIVRKTGDKSPSTNRRYDTLRVVVYSHIIPPEEPVTHVAAPGPIKSP